MSLKEKKQSLLIKLAEQGYSDFSPYEELLLKEAIVGKTLGYLGTQGSRLAGFGAQKAGALGTKINPHLAKLKTAVGDKFAQGKQFLQKNYQQGVAGATPAQGTLF